MAETEEIDYGPLSELIGTWTGDKGMDIAPEPDGTEENPYYETITYTDSGTVTNAESQVLSIVHYRQIVKRKSNDGIFHDETGYWLWDPREKIVMHSLVIPRAVCLIAGGSYHGEKDTDGNLIIRVSAATDDKNWNIIQSPFMKENARTTAFQQTITVGKGKMFYTETTMVNIYGKTFEHSDENSLTRN